MSIYKSEYRRKNGGRLAGHALTARVAHEISGMMLAQAFITAKSAGFPLQIHKHDGIVRVGGLPIEGERVIVDVVNGFVSRSWAADH